MKRPSFQFYPADWRNNEKLRRCSEAARGAWVDVICVLHDSDEYGVVRYNLAELARTAGCRLALLKELVEKRVLKGSDTGSEAYMHTTHHSGKEGRQVMLLPATIGPCWYSSRLVRDEWLRSVRGKSTHFSADNQPSKNPRQGDRQGTDDSRTPTGRPGDGATSSSTSSTPVVTTVSRNTSTRPATGSHPGNGSSTSTPTHASHSVANAQRNAAELLAAAANAVPPPNGLTPSEFFKQATAKTTPPPSTPDSRPFQDEA